MSKTPYTKPALTFAQQLQQLKDRGLVIEDEQKALHLLEVISYYRLSGYWYPFLADKEKHRFKEQATFNTAFKIYCFDRELRLLVLRELEKIEVAIRSRLIYIMSHAHGAFWFQDPQLFDNPVRHANTLAKIGEEYTRSDEQFIKAFREKYSDPLPPSWMTLEITSFGSLSLLYQKLKNGREKRAIAHHFGLADTVFQTWLHSIVYLRNVCAHHTRLWNRAMSITPQLPRNPHNQWLNYRNINNNRVYFILSMIKYLLQSINPRNSFRARLDELLERYPNIDVKAMGFPESWKQEPLWT